MTLDEQHQPLVNVTIDVKSEPQPDLVLGYHLLELCAVHYGPLRENQATVEDGQLRVTFTTRTKSLSGIDALKGLVEREIGNYDEKYAEPGQPPRRNLDIRISRSY